MSSKATRIVWITDVHLNFLDERALASFHRELAREKADYLIVTGDTGEAYDVFHFMEGMAEASGAVVYYVLGNHDFYGSSIRRVREIAESKVGTRARWLPACGPVLLDREGPYLIGVDGWGDGQLGNSLSKVKLSDWREISDLRGIMMSGAFERCDLLKKLGEAEAATLRDLLVEVPETCKDLIVATHVPPFPGAAWHEGRQSEPDWMPWFSCKAVGDELAKHAEENPQRKITVLCGHTHGVGFYKHSENLVVKTGGWAPQTPTYRNPIIQESFVGFPGEGEGPVVQPIRPARPSKRDLRKKDQ
jgi:predicted phosphodiesterase